jgi:hypothetical protein
VCGGIEKRSISFRDDNEIGDLHDALFRSLQSIPAARWNDQEKQVRDLVDVDFTLTLSH